MCARVETETFRHSRAALIATGRGCWTGAWQRFNGVPVTCGGPLEAHHRFEYQWCVQQQWSEQTRDGVHNLIILCQVHHEGAGHGIHEVTYSGSLAKGNVGWVEQTGGLPPSADTFPYPPAPAQLSQRADAGTQWTAPDLGSS